MRALPAFGVLFFFGTMLAACTGEVVDEPIGTATDAIQGGYGDDGDRAVVGLAMADEAGNINRTCSGTLIAESLVLTAQHCIAETSKFVDCQSSEFGPAMSAERVLVTTAASMWSHIAVWHKVSSVLPPPGTPEVCGRDVALVVLTGVIAPDEATPLTPRLDRAVDTAEPYSAIGFGASAEGSGDAGLRRRRDELLVSCVGPSCGSEQHVDGREWRGDSGICNGDSGGPAIDARGRVVGVTSRGPVGCDDPIYGGLPAHKSWIRAVAADAARAGGYVPPDWLDPSATGEAADALPTEAWTSCATAPAATSPRPSREILTAVASALAALGARRRRSARGLS